VLATLAWQASRHRYLPHPVAFRAFEFNSPPGVAILLRQRFKLLALVAQEWRPHALSPVKGLSAIFLLSPMLNVPRDVRF
jgi:hypothetical protein